MTAQPVGLPAFLFRDTVFTWTASDGPNISFQICAMYGAMPELQLSSTVNSGIGATLELVDSTRTLKYGGTLPDKADLFGQLNLNTHLDTRSATADFSLSDTAPGCPNATPPQNGDWKLTLCATLVVEANAKYGTPEYTVELTADIHISQTDLAKMTAVTEQ